MLTKHQIQLMAYLDRHAQLAFEGKTLAAWRQSAETERPPAPEAAVIVQALAEMLTTQYLPTSPRVHEFYEQYHS